MDHQRALKCSQRLRTIAQELRVDLTIDLTPLPPPDHPPTFSIPDDERKADAILGQLRIEDSASKPPSKGLKRAFTKAPKPSNFTYPELYSALCKVVQDDGLVGVVEVLLKRFRGVEGDINVSRRASTGVITRMRNADVSEERGRLLQIATERGRVDIVRLLAAYADQMALDESLGIALQRRDLGIVEILLRHGANSTVYEDFFKGAAANGDVELLQLMLRTIKRVSAFCISQALLPATLHGSLVAVSLLVQAGADANYDDASAFMSTVETARVDLTVSIMSGQLPPRGEAVDKALDSIFSTPSPALKQAHLLIEVLLCGSPVGNAANEGLFKATMLANGDMMRLLLTYNVDINYGGASAVGSTIRRNRRDLLDILLQDQSLDPEIASDLVRQIPATSQPLDRAAMLSKLLVNGATGTNCSELLITAVKQNDMETAQLLVFYGRDGDGPVCSVDYNAAHCFQVAVATDNVPMVKLLALNGQPSVYSLQKAFEAIPASLSRDNYYLMVQTLLRAGAVGPEVNAALHAAVVSQHKSPRLVQLFVEKHTHVEDQTIFAAVSQGSVEILAILLSGSVSSAICSAAIPMVIKQHTTAVRYRMIQILIGPARASGEEVPEISQAIIDVLQNSPEDKKLLHLLCHEGKANVNFKKGFPIILAVKNPDPVLLDIVLQSQGQLPAASTVEMALKCAMDLPPTDVHKRHKIEAILRRSKPKDAINAALIQNVNTVVTLKQDPSVIQVLLEAGADVNADNGAVLCSAISDPTITDMILSKHPNPNTVTRALLPATKLQGKERYTTFEKLIRAGAHGDNVSKAFNVIVKEGLPALPELKLLLPHVDINFKDGRALRMAVRQVFVEGVDLLIAYQNIPLSPVTKISSFNEAMQIKARDDRHAIVTKLLAAVHPGTVALSEALIGVISSPDMQMVERLLRSGASVEHNGGLAIRNAVSSGEIEILKLLVGGQLSSKPTLSTLTSGFAGALTLKEKDKEAYVTTVQILLEAGMKGEAIDSALVDAVKEGDSSCKLVEILLKHGASAEYRDGEALDLATRLFSFGVLKLFFEKQLSENVLKRAYRSTSSLQRDQRLQVIELILKAGKVIDKHVSKTLTAATEETTADRNLIKLLLKYDVFDEGQSLSHAAKSLDLRTLTLLLNSPKAAQYLPAAFNEVVKMDNIWNSDVGFAVVELMLKKGASGDVVGEALCQAAEKCLPGSETLSTKFLDILLKYGGDVNYQHGLCLQRATMQANFALIQKLLPHASPESKAIALPYLFACTDDKATVLKTIRAFVESGVDDGQSLDAGFTHPDSSLEPVLFTALDKFPRETEILGALLELGHPAHQWKLYSSTGADSDAEPWQVLLWALDQPQKKVSSKCIEMLIDGKNNAKANVNFKTKSGITPLMLAIQHQRSDVVAKLISNGANVSVAASEDITPLALASSLGNATMMESLLQADAECDDGSLHDAARELRLDSMRLLMKYGHAPDYPSDRHDGRSALAELCLNAVEYDPKPAALEEGIRSLILEGANIRLRSSSEGNNGKTIFHHALDSSDPLLILTVMLKTMWEFVNEDAFLFVDKTHTYSLSKYVEKDLFQGPSNQKADILQLLRIKRVEDRFWATSLTGAQPPDSCGEPPHIKDEIIRQQKRQKHKSEQMEDARALVELKRMTMISETQIMELQTAADIKRKRELHGVDKQLLIDTEDTKLQLGLYGEQQRMKLLMEKHDREISHRKALGEAERATQSLLRAESLEAERSRSIMQIEYVEKKARLDNETVKQRLAIEGSAMKEDEKVFNRRHEKELARIKMQGGLVEKNMAFARTLQQGQQGVPLNQRQLGYVMGEVG